MEVFPAVVKNTSDSMCYIVLWLYHNTILHRTKAIDLKISNLLLGNRNGTKGEYFFGGNPAEPYAIDIPLCITEFPVLETRWHPSKTQRFLKIPIKLDSPKFFEDIYSQLNGKTVDKDIKEKIESFIKKENWKIWKEKDPFFWEKLRDCFLELFPNVYDEIQVSVNYQDDSSGVRKTTTKILSLVKEKDITDTDWIAVAKNFKKRKHGKNL